MEFDLFSILGLALSIWVLMSPCWPLVGRQHGDLQQPLLEAEDRADINKFLLSWFTLSVAGSVYWAWFFWIGNTSVEYQGALVWSDFSGFLCITIIITFVINTTLLLRLSIIDPKKTLLFLSSWIAGFSLINFLVLLCEGSTKAYITGSVGLALTVSSNICRILSSYSTLAMTVALAGAIAGIMWMPRFYAFDHGTKEVHKYGFWNVIFKKIFFWKLSLTVGSIIRGRDVIFLVVLAGGLANVCHKIIQSLSWLKQKVVQSTDNVKKTCHRYLFA